MVLNYFQVLWFYSNYLLLKYQGYLNILIWNSTKVFIYSRIYISCIEEGTIYAQYAMSLPSLHCETLYESNTSWSSAQSDILVYATGSSKYHGHLLMHFEFNKIYKFICFCFLKNIIVKVEMISFQLVFIKKPKALGIDHLWFQVDHVLKEICSDCRSSQIIIWSVPLRGNDNFSCETLFGLRTTSNMICNEKRLETCHKMEEHCWIVWSFCFRHSTAWDKYLLYSLCTNLISYTYTMNRH